LLVGLVSLVMFSGCTTPSTSRLATYNHLWKGYSYDEIFDAALYAFNNNGEVIVESNRSSGTIHTRLKINGIDDGDNYYLITKSKNAIYYSASFYFICNGGNEYIYIENVNSDEWKRCYNDAVHRVTQIELPSTDFNEKYTNDEIVQVEVSIVKHLTGNWTAYQENTTEHIDDALKTISGN